MSWPVENSRGTTPQAVMKDWSALSEGCDSSRKKARTLRAMRAQLTRGGGPPWMFSSPIGIMPMTPSVAD